MRTENGIPHYRFRKQIVRVGKFVKKNTNQRFEVTRPLLQHWADTFAQMKANGVRVAVPLGHTDRDEKNQGWIEGMEVDGDALVASFHLVGERAPELAATHDVSIYVPPEFTDGENRTYKRPITHVALVHDPVVPGLGDWIPIAASNSSEELVVLEQEDILSFSGSRTMDFQKIAEALGVLGEINEKNAEEVILAAVAKMKAELDSLKKQLGIEPTPEPKKEEPAPAEGDKKETTVAASFDPRIDALMAENRRMKLDKLVEAGKLAPAAREKIVQKYATDGALALSHGNDGFDDLLEALSHNTPMMLSQTSGHQSRVLPNPGKSDEDDILVKDAERRLAMTKAKA